MSLSMTLLGSGSSGNATLVSDGDRHILVDIGLSARETIRRLETCGLGPEKISAIVISHEHGDHCRGVHPFAKHLEIPVFMTEPAFRASGMPLNPARIERIEAGVPFDVYGMKFTPFTVPHDAADPIGLRISNNGVKIGIVLDLGYISNLVVERLRGCDAIVLESNHDLNMLKVGPYPWSLKQRVMSRRGHLSNDAVAEFLGNGFDGSARHVILAHLSKKNNHPEIAMLSARNALAERDGLVNPQTSLHLAEPDRVSRRFRF
jgi:phosphoribosyl 1,2-cyclic phosphodiesterase